MSEARKRRIFGLMLAEGRDVARNEAEVKALAWARANGLDGGKEAPRELDTQVFRSMLFAIKHGR